MNRTDAFYQKYGLYINIALIETFKEFHLNNFRQKDLKASLSVINEKIIKFKDEGVFLKNTQIQRLLDHFVDVDYLHKSIENQRPTYKFTSYGIIQIIKKLVNEKDHNTIESFLFKYHSIKKLNEEIDQLIPNLKGKEKIFKSTLQELLSLENLLYERIGELEEQIKDINKTIKNPDEKIIDFDFWNHIKGYHSNNLKLLKKIS